MLEMFFANLCKNIRNENKNETLEFIFHSFVRKSKRFFWQFTAEDWSSDTLLIYANRLDEAM